MINTENQPGPERHLVPPGEDNLQAQLDADKLQRVAWVEQLAPWEVMATFTFDPKRYRCVSAWSARRILRKAMQARLPGVSYYAVAERNPSRDGYHLHALWADCKSVNRKIEWAHWFNRYGRARIEPVRKREDVASYASKYLSKDTSEVDIVLRSHHRERINGTPFKLS